MIINDRLIEQKALAEAKILKKKVAREFVDHLPQEESAVSVFMAGSPGAGKTETARNMHTLFNLEHNVELVHIENDDLRKRFADYNGLNSPLFQKPATLLVEAIHDRALERGVSFVLDSTLSNFEKAKMNIERSLKRNRFVLIIFVYQEPEQAWKLVKAREIVEGRRVPEEVFVRQFMESQRVVGQLKSHFEQQIELMFIEKNMNGHNDEPYFNVNDIDALLGKKYNQQMLEAIVGLKHMSVMKDK